MNLLITGAAGFIGSALTTALHAAGHAVTALDDLSVHSPRPRPDHLVERDVRTLTPADLDDFHTVVHLAAHKSVPASFDPGGFEHNTAVDRHILHTFAASAAGPLLLASSCEVYGEQSGPLAESAPHRPRSPYAAGKAATEHLADIYRPRLGPGLGDGNYVAPEFVDMLFEQLAALRRLDDRTGGGPLSQRQARIALHESLTLIHTGRHNAATGNRLLRYAASAAQLAGWMSFDAGLDPAGHRYQLLAIRIARAAGDTTTVSNALGMLAYQHAAGSNPRLALRFAHAAVEHSARAVPLVQARAWGRLATAQAAAGDLDAFRRATDRCRQLIGQRHSDDPPSLYYFTPQQIDAESGQALVDLAGHTRGRRSLLLEEAAELLNPTAAQGTATGYRRSGHLHGIHLVRASIGARDTEATAHWITALTTTLPQVQSIRCRTLLARVRTAAVRQLRAAGHSDALDALRTALSAP